MKSYPVFLMLSVAACGGKNGEFFDEIEGPMNEMEAPPPGAADPLDDPPSDGTPGDGAAPVDDGPPAGTDEGPRDDLPIGDAQDPPGGADDAPLVTEPEGPSILSVSPTDGAIGVSNEQPIVVTFSTPMDRQATERAYQSEGIPSSSVTFSWNDQSTVLTITPNEPLAYDTGTDADEVVARRFTFFISASAIDVDGSSLGSTAEFGFSLFRQVTGSFASLQNRDLTGSFRSDATYGDGQCARVETTLCVGDSGTAEDEQYKGFMSFDLGGISPAMARLDSAQLVLQVTETSGNPFGNLGDLLIEHAAFDVIGSDAFDADPLRELGVIATSGGEGSVLRWDVREAVEADFAARNMSQFRFYFESSSDFDGNFDAIMSSWDTQWLEVAYLLP